MINNVIMVVESVVIKYIDIPDGQCWHFMQRNWRL